MERIAIEKLIKWKDSPRRKPLVIEGARQVGKTWLVKEFAQRNYKQLAYVNFEDMKILQNLFVQDFDIPRVLTAIGAATHVTCTEGDTLIFLDEIQAAPNAITSLNTFARMLQVIMSLQQAHFLALNCIRENPFLSEKSNSSICIP